MFTRANNQLEAHAASQAIKHEEALKIDGPRFAFWRKLSGSIPCSCSAKKDPASPQAHVTPGGENPTSGFHSNTGAKHTFGESRSRHTFAGMQDIDGFTFDDDAEDIFEKMEDDATSGMDDDDDILDAMSDAGGNLIADQDSLMDFDDPFGLFSNKMIDCPICFGQSYQDSWQLHNGLRLVLDTSNAYGFEMKGGTIDNTASGPTKLLVSEDGQIYWTAKLPMYFNEVVRAAVYNGIDRIDPALYSFEWISSDNSISGQVNESDLMELIGQDTTLTLVFKNTFGEPLEITHAEIILNYADFQHCQLPEVPAAYEQQFLDWNVSTNAEIPANVDIKEGDYFCDEKYSRVWKINSINRRMTAQHTQFGSSLDISVLHSFERLFEVLNVFR